jgi:hypothetical protein
MLLNDDVAMSKQASFRRLRRCGPARHPLQVRSTPGSRSRLLMDLTANGQVLTGTWNEETSPAGYYKGAV